MDNFFPTEDYQIPQTSNYLKLKEGTHTFRVMSHAITGYVYFTKDNKPVRSQEALEDMPEDIKENGRVNHFWAFVVWNYDAKRLQILEITQKTIMAPFKALIDNSKWGNPKGYDITITRIGSGFNDTEYTLMPNPKDEINEEIKELYEKSNIKLEALYTNDDPFSKNDKSK